MGQITKSAEQRWWVVILVLALLVILAIVLFRESIRGIPEWLKALGLLAWLTSLEPLDKWLTFLAATAIGVYAVFHETLWTWIRRPKLIITFDTVPPYCIPMPVVFLRTQTTVPSLQVRMLVKNAGRTRAADVEVYAKQLREKQGKEYTVATWFLPMNLVWANEEQAYTGISKNVERTCNILGIPKPSKEVDPESVIAHAPEAFDYASACSARLHTSVTPTSYCNYLFPGEYILDLVASSSNARSVPLSMHINFDGRWFGDQKEMFHTGALRISVT